MRVKARKNASPSRINLTEQKDRRLSVGRTRILLPVLSFVKAKLVEWVLRYLFHRDMYLSLNQMLFTSINGIQWDYLHISSLPNIELLRTPLLPDPSYSRMNI